MAKHHSRDDETWEDLLRRSSGREGNGVYRIGRNEVGRIELETVDGRGNEIRPRKVAHVRHFWRDMQQIIGASKGERTQFIYVLYGYDGAVHGYPVTAAWLRRYGVNV